MHQTLENGIRFRPESKNAFSQCAKALAWLLQQPLSRSQEMLARAYGYANLHELQRAMATEGIAGPYSDSVSTEINTARNQRLLALVAHAHDIDSESLPSRLRSVCELGLFLPPAGMRQAYRKLKQLHPQ